MTRILTFINCALTMDDRFLNLLNEAYTKFESIILLKYKKVRVNFEKILIKLIY